MCVWNVLTRRNVRMGTVPKKGTGFLHETDYYVFRGLYVVSCIGTVVQRRPFTVT